ncbi:Ig-like domain-containing protein [Planktothrix tepida]|uniref:Ig-like domain-containing protein n=1 Tax=Planktothrix tepida TaxID=1678309 RepID=UPI001647CEE1|nr:Ig-like domain-containing protein [Planktothrix tepida]
MVGATVTLGSLPLLSSNPNATSKIFLDFNGHTTSGTDWNTYRNGGANIVTPAYSIDADTATFSTTEIANIEQIWKRVAEDYAPFNVDVTTIDPGNLNSAYNIRAVIGGSWDQWFEESGGAGGVAYLTSWRYNNDTPVFVFEENLGNGDPKYTAEAISHEVGHSLGLYHQSTYDANGNKTAEYSSGSGTGETGWAPIMGKGYYQNLTTWHNGTSSLGSTTYQDDMSVISATNNGFGGYRSDDYGNTIASATPLSGTTTLTRSGIITRTSDVDVFSFQTGAGSVNFTINPAQYGPNLDILAQLLDSSGTVIASSNSSSNLFANLNASVSAGTYFVSVKSNGQYGRVGQYSISGTVPSGDTTPPIANSFTPADNATGVAVGANLVVNFNEAIKKGSGNLVIKKLSDNSVVETIAVTAANITVSGSQLTINPTANLLQGTDYYIGIANGAIKDIAGNNYAGITGNSTWNFKTVLPTDTTPPTANSFTPADNATGVAVAANLVVNFSEAIQKGSGNLVIKKLSDNSVVETIAVTATNITVSGSQLTINPTANLAQNTDYYIGIANGAIKDTAGNNYAGITGNSTWNFKTQTLSSFTPDTSVSPPGVSASSVAWSDYNGDGKQDFLLTGYDNSWNPISKLYKNTGSGFIEDTSISLPGVLYGSVAWSDYNGDGKSDFLLTGSDSSYNYISKLYKNTGSGFIEDTSISLPGVWQGSVAWADYNGDGKPDFLLTGYDNSYNYISKLYKNTGSGFSEDTSVSLPGVYGSSVAWADYNGDGKPDFLLTGSDSSYNYISKLYKNTTTTSDTTPPKASSFTPGDNSTIVAVDANLVVNFSEAIKKGTGNIVIKKLSDNSVVETIAVTATNVILNGNQLTTNPTANLVTGTSYYVEIANGAIKDIAGNNYVGITGNSTWNFKTQGFPPINGTVNNDILTGTANPETINGLGGNDQLLGNGGNDSLNGGDGIDTLNGGAGNDLLTGGLGADKFIYNTNAVFATSAVGVDTIADFNISQTDQIVLDKTTFTSISSIAGTGFSVTTEFAKVTTDALAATSAADIVYNTATGGLFYNQNSTAAGFGTGAKFLTLTTKPVLTATQFVIQA